MFRYFGAVSNCLVSEKSRVRFTIQTLLYQPKYSFPRPVSPNTFNTYFVSSLLEALAKLIKATISVVVSACPSVSL